MKVTVIDLTCVACEFKCHDFALETRRGAFFHLLRHRDCGHDVPSKLLDAYDPELDPLQLPPHDPGRKGRQSARNQTNPTASNSYGKNPSEMVLPEKRGGVRGKFQARFKGGSSYE